MRDIVDMTEDDVVVMAAPEGKFPEVLHKSLLEALIPAQLVPIDSVPAEVRPSWVGEDVRLRVYVVVPKGYAPAAEEVTRRVWRFCQDCETPLLAEARCCHECGASHDTPPSFYLGP